MMSGPRVVASSLPHGSALCSRVGSSDFLDSFSVASDMPPRAAAEIIVDFPGWTRALLFLRGILTSPFGLSSEGPDAPDKVGPFPVEVDTGTELIAGFDDRHLDFRISVFSEEGRVSLSTWVHVHNLGGRLYLSAILPFHILVAQNALRRLASASAA